jgi:hypothetical protein
MHGLPVLDGEPPIRLPQVQAEGRQPRGAARSVGDAALGSPQGSRPQRVGAESGTGTGIGELELMAKQRIEIEVEIPPGYEATGEHRKVSKDEYWLDASGAAFQWEELAPSSGRYIILRKIEPLAVKLARYVVELSNPATLIVPKGMAVQLATTIIEAYERDGVVK